MATPAGSPLARTCTVVYKLLTEAEYKELPTTDTPYYGTAFDLSTGFHHLSTSLHLSYVLHDIFDKETVMWILAIPREAPGVVVEFWKEVGGEEFDESVRIQGGLDTFRQVAIRRKITRTSVDGTWDIGELQW